MGDVQPQPADAKDGGDAAIKADEEDKKGAKDAKTEDKPEEMSFFEKLALKAAKLTGNIPIEAVFQEKVLQYRCCLIAFV
jgi:hypothetical protein